MPEERWTSGTLVFLCIVSALVTGLLTGVITGIGFKNSLNEESEQRVVACKIAARLYDPMSWSLKATVHTKEGCRALIERVEHQK